MSKPHDAAAYGAVGVRLIRYDEDGLRAPWAWGDQPGELDPVFNGSFFVIPKHPDCAWLPESDNS